MLRCVRAPPRAMQQSLVAGVGRATNWQESDQPIKGLPSREVEEGQSSQINPVPILICTGAYEMPTQL